MIILDIETTGTDANKNGMLSLGAVHYETGETFYGECHLTEGREIHPIALEINGFTLEQIHNKSLPSDGKLLMNFIIAFSHLKDNLIGGHNVGHLDLLFIEEIFGRDKRISTKFPFSYRTVDLHSLAYQKFGESLSHEQICKRLGLEPEQKPHNALKGALSERDAFKILLQKSTGYSQEEIDEYSMK